ncbi:hypothetical protein BGY98DRAFT_1000937 [Russula aff. rugulosa BPL654]|nr:hypothetical protein BGY98DRAFT_1000937 [Russula aff. rugulosa BPL654]
MVPDAQRPSEPPHYKLYGVLYHQANLQARALYDDSSPDGDGNTGEDWLHIDDEVVTQMGHEDVFGEQVLSGRLRSVRLPSLLFSHFPDRYIMNCLHSYSRMRFSLF